LLDSSRPTYGDSLLDPGEYLTMLTIDEQLTQTVNKLKSVELDARDWVEVFCIQDTLIQKLVELLKEKYSAIK